MVLIKVTESSNDDLTSMSKKYIGRLGRIAWV